LRVVERQPLRTREEAPRISFVSFASLSVALAVVLLNKYTFCSFIVALGVLTSVLTGVLTMADSLIIHNVYFALLDSSTPARQKLLDSIHRYLPNHAGVAYFAAGVVCDVLDREVNVRDWDVGLHIVFVDQAAHDAYQISVPHKTFIEENKATWRNVRVFDSVGKQTPTS
jgi:hypothetical protein